MDIVFSAFDPSQALDSILRWDEREMMAQTPVSPSPYLNLEALAQTCGLHLRRRNDFRVQAFLVSVSDLAYPGDAVRAAWTITARLRTETAGGAGYDVEINGVPGGTVVMGRRDLPRGGIDTFSQERFQWLCTRSSRS